MTKLDLGGTAIWHDQSSRIQSPPEAPLRYRWLVDDVPLEAKNARMRAALAVYREIAAELNADAESALVVSNCGSALIKFCHRIAAASPVPMCIYMQLPCIHPSFISVAGRRSVAA